MHSWRRASGRGEMARPWHAGRNRFGREPARVRGILDLLRADPAARAFYPRVVARDEMAESVVAAARELAGSDGSLTTHRER
ncbi:hypothetical protein AQ476_27960 [Burkholderia thailandensis]|nr:hypothetical protein AQ476_27960 [Burkholderia thailandensis]